MEKDDLIVNDILTGAKLLFAKHGLKKTTMEEIAQAAGKGKSTLYYYFPSKSEIFEAVVEEEMKTFIKKLRHAINSNISAKDKLKAFLGTHLSSVIHYQNLSSVLKSEIFDSMCVLLAIRQKYEQTQVDMIKEIILGGVQSGEFKDLSSTMIDKFSFVAIAAFRGLEFPLAVSHCDLKSEQYFDVLVDLLIEGIGKK